MGLIILIILVILFADLILPLFVAGFVIWAAVVLIVVGWNMFLFVFNIGVDIEPRPAPIEYVISQPQPDPKTIYVTQVFPNPNPNLGRIEKKITLEECRALPGYRGVTYGICVTR